MVAKDDFSETHRRRCSRLRAYGIDPAQPGVMVRKQLKEKYDFEFSDSGQTFWLKALQEIDQLLDRLDGANPSEKGDTNDG